MSGIQLSLDKKVTHKNGVNPSLYRPSNELIELGIDFIARNGHLVAFYIFGKGVNKKLGLWDVTDDREVWHIQLSLNRISGKHDSRVQLKWVDPGKDPEHPSGLYAIIDGSMWCDLYLGRY